MIGGYNPWWVEEFIRRCREKRAAVADQLATGVAQDYADYRWSVGMAAGLAAAIEIAEEVKRECERT